jgi:hypothetical protein
VIEAPTNSLYNVSKKCLARWQHQFAPDADLLTSICHIWDHHWNPVWLIEGNRRRSTLKVPGVKNTNLSKGRYLNQNLFRATSSGNVINQRYQSERRELSSIESEVGAFTSRKISLAGDGNWEWLRSSDLKWSHPRKNCQSGETARTTQLMTVFPIWSRAVRASEISLLVDEPI